MGRNQMSEAELLALPVSVPLVTAGRAFGYSRDATYDVVRRGQFPCKVINIGGRKKVAKAELLRVLGIRADDGAGRA